jgi:hypothetical protein
VVIDPVQPQDCLDPQLPFAVSGGGFLSLKAGEKIRLPLFANRDGAAIEYSWTVTQRPAGSSVAIVNPKGAVTLSRHWQYAYPDGHVPSFTADLDGDYTLQLSANLAFPDRAYPASDTDTAELRLSAEPGAGRACSVTGLTASLTAVALASVTLLRRRKIVKKI